MYFLLSIEIKFIRISVNYIPQSLIIHSLTLISSIPLWLASAVLLMEVETLSKCVLMCIAVEYR